MHLKRFLHQFRPKNLHPLRQPPKHWKDDKELHDVLHSFPGYFTALLLELLEQPKSRDALETTVKQLEVRMAGHHQRDLTGINLDRDLADAGARGVLEEHAGKYALTPGGREIAEHMPTVIPFFFDAILSVRGVSMTTITVHILLSVLKLLFGLLSMSAGLIADGIDNTADTLSSVLVWFGITFHRERLVAIFIVVMMFVSVGGVALTSYHKFVRPEPLQAGLLAFLVSAGSGLLMLLISAYQYLVGKKHGNFAILCQAVDSRNHFFTSLLVCGGMLLSFLAARVQAVWAHWLLYADAAASVIIGLVILRSAVELAHELIKPGTEPTDIAHFVKSMQEHTCRQIVLNWLARQLQDRPLTRDEIAARFRGQFCGQTPKILTLTGMGYCPQSSVEVLPYLDELVRCKKLSLTEEKYMLEKE